MRFLYALLFIAYAAYGTSVYGSNIITPFGLLEIKDPAVKELIQSTAFQRLKKLTYLGLHSNLDPIVTYSRYDHTIGVLFIMEHLPIPQQEKVTLMLRHMAHIALLDSPLALDAQVSADQTEKSIEFLKKHNIHIFLKKYNLSFDEVIDDIHRSFIISSQFPSPFDYMEYILHFGILKGKITPEEVTTVISNLSYDEPEKMLYFKSLDIAKKVGMLSLKITKFQQKEIERLVIYHWLKQMIDYALSKNLLTQDDLYEKTDAEILRILGDTKDFQIAQLFEKIKIPSHGFQVITSISHTMGNKNMVHFPVKYHPLDPKIWIKNSMESLTNIDSNFQEAYNLIIDNQDGILIQFTP